MATELLNHLADAFALVECEDKRVSRIHMNLKHVKQMRAMHGDCLDLDNSGTIGSNINGTHQGYLWGAAVQLRQDLPDGSLVLVPEGAVFDLEPGWVPDPTQITSFGGGRASPSKVISHREGVLIHKGMTPKLRVVIESPLKGDYERNRKYAKACMRDSLARGEAPYASHLLYAQDGILDDTDAEERKTGMEAGFAWGTAAELVAVYEDLGISDGMRKGIELWESLGTTVERRTLPPEILEPLIRGMVSPV